MRKIHLIWIIPLVLVILIIGFVIGVCAMSNNFFYHTYPVIKCIYTMEEAMHVDTNILPVTKESQRRAIEYRCAIESIPNITKGLELEELWVERDMF